MKPSLPKFSYLERYFARKIRFENLIMGNLKEILNENFIFIFQLLKFEGHLTRKFRFQNLNI